jgi:hypothetical protein
VELTKMCRAILAAVAGLMLVAGVSVAADKPDPDLHLSGTLDIDQTRVSFLVSGNGGGGTLHYKGKSYPFAIGGLGIGGIGVTKLSATGKVYNMTDKSKFTGVYSELRTGYAAGEKGHGKLWLKNTDGVVIELKGKNEGVGLTLGADAVHISYK